MEFVLWNNQVNYSGYSSQSITLPEFLFCWYSRSPPHSLRYLLFLALLARCGLSTCQKLNTMNNIVMELGLDDFLELFPSLWFYWFKTGFGSGRVNAGEDLMTLASISLLWKFYINSPQCFWNGQTLFWKEHRHLEERGLPFLPPPDLFFWLVKTSLRMDGCVYGEGGREGR